MKRILFVALAWGNCIAQAANVQIVDGSTRAKTVHLLQGGQRIEIPSVEMQVDIGVPGGGSAEADILLIYEPKTGLSLWRYQDRDPDNPGGITERFEQDSVVIAQDDRLVEFQLIGASLWVRQSREKFSTMSDAQRSLRTQIERFGATIRSVMVQSYREVNLGEALDVDFVYERGNPDPSRSVKLREVSAAGSGWRVVLDGPNGDAIAVTIGEEYEIKAVAPASPPASTP